VRLTHRHAESTQLLLTFAQNQTVTPLPTQHHLTVFWHHFFTPNLLLSKRPHFLPTHDMADQSEPNCFRALFESALQAYDEKAGIILADHPLAVQLQSCHSIESITTVLQGQAQAFSEFRASDKVMKSIKSSVSILIRLSATASLGNSDTIDLVRHKALMAHSTALTVFTAISTYESNMCWSRYLT